MNNFNSIASVSIAYVERNRAFGLSRFTGMSFKIRRDVAMCCMDLLDKHLAIILIVPIMLTGFFATVLIGCLPLRGEWRF
jgi:hypothetical protein